MFRAWAPRALLVVLLMVVVTGWLLSDRVPVARAHATIVVVAAENEYGSMAQAIGGNRVSVTSLLTNPNIDPHLFEASASTARTVSEARLVIKNGIGYDSWIDKLLSASPRSGRLVFSVGEYLGHHAGDNPHVWYVPSGWAREAATITADLVKLDPGDRAYFQQRKAAWLGSLQPVFREIAAVRQITKGATVIATEPVYGYMIAALGATSLDYDFQKAIMDSTDPSPRSVAAFEAALQHHSARMLFYNSQVVGPTTSSMRTIAQHNHVPIVGVTETQPPQLSFVRWQLSQLQSIKQHWK
jgi:zinc/manganese transport system substrate-binding protein